MSDSDCSPVRPKRKKNVLEGSPGGSSSSSSPPVRPRRRPPVIEDDSDSSDSGSFVGFRPKRKKVPVVTSDTEPDSSGSDIVPRRKRPARVESDDFSSDSDSSQWETDGVSDAENGPAPEANPKRNDDAVESDFSDGQSDKCPICLLSFTNQEIGSPEMCDHIFCVECIQEWSKNMNTCPVDRQEFSLILVRKKINGKVYKQIPVEPPNPQSPALEAISEDQINCEICGSAEGEDRMLLCDGCDLGFHLECLTPALNEVPAGSWYCNVCAPHHLGDDVELYDVTTYGYDEEPAQRQIPRLVPRTLRSERVRRRIVNNRNNQAGQVVSSSSQTRTPRRKKKKKKQKTRGYKIVYELDKATGETVAVKKPKLRKVKPKRRRINRRESRPIPKTTKKRLAVQLGICAPRSVFQNLPDVKVQSHGSSLGQLRAQQYQAGVPTLDLFGHNNDLDYFSDSDDEGSGYGVVVRRAPTRADANALRRRARLKTVALPTSSVSSSTDVLGSILETQSKFHSKNTQFSLGKNGKFTMDSNSNRVALNNYEQFISRRPTTTSTTSDSVPSSSGRSSNDYHRNNDSNTYNSPPSSSYAASALLQNSSGSASTNANDEDVPQDYSIRLPASVEESSNKNKKKDGSESGTPRSTSPCSGGGSDVDIYSDIETVSTSKADEGQPSPSPSGPPPQSPVPNDDEDNDSEPDMVIDTDKAPVESEDHSAVTSTVDLNPAECFAETPSVSSANFEIQSQAVQSSSQLYDDQHHHQDNEDEEDGCPNFSIYSAESITLAKNTDISLPAENENETQNDCEVSSADQGMPEPKGDHEPEHDLEPQHGAEPEPESESAPAHKPVQEDEFKPESASQQVEKKKSSNGLYSDSEDESVVKKDSQNNIFNMTEDISEEERSYTPCLDEKPTDQGLEGLDTEMISDEDKNDFDESQELKTVSDGDALEINAKESELDFTRPEDYEEGEIVDKNKTLEQKPEETNGKEEEKKEEEGEEEEEEEEEEREPKQQEETLVTVEVAENESNKESSFKKLSRSNKERNYRDKDKQGKDRSKSRERDKQKKSEKENRKERKKRKEIERYDVRALIAEKPRRLKDKFGRDIRRSTSRSKNKSVTPKRSVSRTRRSLSKTRRSLSPKVRRSASPRRARTRSPSRGRKNKRRKFSRNRKSGSRSRSRTPRRSRSKTKKRKRSESRRRLSRDRGAKKQRSRSRQRSLSRRREWSRRHSRDWTPSLSRSPEPRHFTPSWTPPRLMESAVKPHNLTVILTNDANKKKKDKRKRGEKKSKENDKQKKRRRDRTPPPSKEVFASGDNILVSVSFNKENETRDVSTASAMKRRKENDKSDKPKKRKRQKRNKDLSGIKPVAIIDLERSPFKEITPSPKDVIVLSDSDAEPITQETICDSSQQVASPEANFLSTGPKTPPEPQVKFTLMAKPPQMRAITNPLHEPEEPEEEEVSAQENVEHKGPNTPPEPPNSPPSSPDAYDPFEPTKSRSPTPEPMQATQSKVDDSSIIENRSSDLEKSSINALQMTPDALKSHTPPLADIQPADSQSSIHATPEPKSPDRVNQSVQIQPVIASKPVAQAVPFSSVPSSIITSTPTITAPSRINILNTTIITPPHVASSIPQRIVLPNTLKSSPVKISPTKPTAKSTPIKIVPKGKITRKARNQNGSGDNSDLGGGFDSPYSPGSSDYEDLFDPPAETSAKAQPVKAATTKKSPAKLQNAFDALFGSSPFNKVIKKNEPKRKFSKKAQPTSGKSKGTKQVGVKIDEDNLKILDELPNSAVEMQVKDKFLKKLNRQERVVEEVKLVLKPHYNKKHVNKEEYKDILRRSVPKICHNKSGEINPTKIKNLIEAYVKKIRHSKKVTSSSSVNNSQKA